MTEVTRRATLHFLAAASVGVSACRNNARSSNDGTVAQPAASTPLQTPPQPAASAVRSVFALSQGRPWPTPDPFLFCVHHNDRFPKGNGRFGPQDSLAGRQLGRDFAWKDGWNMYHGRRVPGFPAHPHRGFETVTVVREGRLDHADSLGAAARYGDGDVQWLTAGAGIQHAEMFPLLHTERENPLDLFQIWLNLPRQSKMVKPYFSMHWAEQIPVETFSDESGHKTVVEVRAGRIGAAIAPEPPPDSWAHNPAHGVAIWTAKMEPRAKWTLPSTPPGVGRYLYFFAGDQLSVDGRALHHLEGAELVEGRAVPLQNGPTRSEFLLLAGKPIGEPIAQSGPFVMNSDGELKSAYADYRATRFGGWPWEDDAPVHGQDPGRFARHPDGRLEHPQGS